MSAPACNEPRIVFAGGGTGGHICPAVAVARRLLAERPEARVLFLGSGKPLERRILGPTGLPYEAVPAASPRGGRLPFALSQARGLLQAWGLLRRFRPTAVLGLGGYPSAPGVLAARLLGVPVALFEPNAVAGRANAALARFAREGYVQWSETERGARPLRRIGAPPGDGALAGAPDAAAARQRLGLPPDRPAVLVMGGSQGSGALNAWIRDGVPRLGRPEAASFIHVAGGEEAAAEARAVYARAGVACHVAPFLRPIGDAYRAARVAVVRGGGATLAELLAVGLPAAVVPLPSSADDHQAVNARAFAAAGAGWVIEERRLSAETLGWLQTLSARGELRERAARARAAGRPRAASAVARRLLRLSGAGAGAPGTTPEPRAA